MSQGGMASTSIVFSHIDTQSVASSGSNTPSFTVTVPAPVKSIWTEPPLAGPLMEAMPGGFDMTDQVRVNSAPTVVVYVSLIGKQVWSSPAMSHGGGGRTSMSTSHTCTQSVGSAGSVTVSVSVTSPRPL